MRRRMLCRTFLIGLLMVVYVSIVHMFIELYTSYGIVSHRSSMHENATSRDNGGEILLTVGQTELYDNCPRDGAAVKRHEVTPVLIVTYQRSGSTFLGSLFSQDPSAFYWFEPLDGVYWSLYGIPPGFTVPSDLTTHVNGSERKIPKHEKDALLKTLLNIFTCNFTALPTEVLLHPFHLTFLHRQPALKPYIECVGKETVHKATKCLQIIRHICPARPAPFDGKHTKCFDTLLQKDEQGFYSQNPGTVESVNSFSIYKDCMNKLRKIALSCVPKYEKICCTSTLRVVKTIRLGMDDAETLTGVLPQLKVLHNIRHPYGIARSRRKENEPELYMSKYSEKSLEKEARVLCRKLYNDLRISKRLAQLSKTNAQIIVYERLAKYPNEIVKDILKFIGHSLSPEIKSWLTQETKNSRSLSEGWMSMIKVKQYYDLQHDCSLLTDFREYFINI